MDKENIKTSNVEGDFALDMLQSVLNKTENNLLKQLTDQQNLIKDELKVSCEDTDFKTHNENMNIGLGIINVYYTRHFCNIESAGQTVESVVFVKEVTRVKVNNLSSVNLVNNDLVAKVSHNFGLCSKMFPENDLHPEDFIM